MDKGLIITFSFFCVVIALLLHKSFPRVMASDDARDGNIVITPPSVTISGVSPTVSVDAKPQFNVNTNKGDCRIKTNCNFKLENNFITNIRDNSFKFGFTNTLSKPQDCSLVLNSDFPLSNLGCEWDEDDNSTWICDHQFWYESFVFDIEDVINENPKMELNIIKLDKEGKQYQIDFKGLTRLDPATTSQGTVTIDEYYDCNTLNSTLDAQGDDTIYFNCIYADLPICELNARLIIADGGTMNISDHCVVTQNMGGDRTGANSTIVVESGGELEISNSATFNSSDDAVESTIWYELGSTGRTKDSTIGNMGQGTGINRYGFIYENENNEFVNNTVGAGKWFIVLGGVTYASTRTITGYNIIANNSGASSVTRVLTLQGSSNNNISGNDFDAFSGSAIYITDSDIGGAVYNYPSNNTISKNDFNSGLNVLYGIRMDSACVDGCVHNIINDNTIKGIEKNQNGVTCECIAVIGNYNNITDNLCDGIGGDNSLENGNGIGISGHYNYVNGTTCENIGGALCDGSYCITISGQNNTVENDIDLILNSAKSCGIAIGLTESAVGNYIDENYLEIMNGDTHQMLGVETKGDNNIIKNIMITMDEYGTGGICIEGDNNTFVNVHATADSTDVPYSMLNFEEGIGNLVMDSNLTCTGANCGENNEVCHQDEKTYAISGDYNYLVNDAGIYRNTLLNTTYDQFCAGDVAGQLDIYELEVKWYLDVKVTDQNGYNMDEVSLNLSNSTNSKIEDSYTNSDGEKRLNATQLVQNHTCCTWDETPLYLNASREDVATNHSRIPFTTNTFWGITLFTSVQDTYNYFYFFILLVAIILIIVGRKTGEFIFGLCAGMLFIVTAIMLFREGHPALTNAFLDQTIPFILLGIGAFFMIEGVIKVVEDNLK